jgi:hypothetical protein
MTTSREATTQHDAGDQSALVGSAFGRPRIFRALRSRRNKRRCRVLQKIATRSQDGDQTSACTGKIETDGAIVLPHGSGMGALQSGASDVA